MRPGFDPVLAAGGEDLLDFLPPAEAERLLRAVATGDTHGARWHRHVDGTGGDLLRVRTTPGSLLVVVNSHNMAFYAWEEAARRGLVRPGAHAIHVDYHPDFFAPEEPLPPDEGSEQSLRIARGLRWNDWITAAFVRGAIDRLTDVSLGDLDAHPPPFVAVPTPGGMLYLEAGLDRGEAHPFLIRLDAPVSGCYRLLREGGLHRDATVFVDPRDHGPPGDTATALALVARVAEEGVRVEPSGTGGDGILLDLEEGPVWIVAVAPGDGDAIPPPLSARFDPDATEAVTGVPIRRLRRDATTLEALCADPPRPWPAGTILDVDLDWLNVHREDGRPDEDTVTPARVEAFVRDLRRIVPEPGLVTVALSPDCLSPTLQARDLEEAGLGLVKPPPPHLGMREGRRRLALFLRAWRGYGS